MEKWYVVRKGADFQEIGEKFQIHPVLARLIRNRDVIGEEAIRCYLHGTIADLHDGNQMKDMGKAVDILKGKICAGNRIRITGDYDIDGVNASYILLEGIRTLGGSVDVDIPDRMKDGYGLNRNLIDRAFGDGIDTIVTCDNGIAAQEETAYGKSLGMTVVVTDHHEIPFEETGEGKRYMLPAADAVVDPKQPDCAYPFKELCGAAVAYKLVEALFSAFGKNTADLEYLIENVAIATVGDVMELIGENRILVKHGLRLLGRTRNFGLRALMECTGIQAEQISAYHIGFVLGPCLNAGGRLDTAKRALDLLCAETVQEADLLAQELKALNDSRKDMTAQAVEEAVRQIEAASLNEDRVLVVYLPDCHESLAGIVAGRIRERYYKPVFIVTKAEEGAKGSGRSIEEYHMYDELTKCKSLLTKFGGHKLAAGFSLPMENVERLRQMLNEVSELTEESLVQKVSIDMQLPLGYLSEAFVEELKFLEPFGKGNTKPVFVEKEIELLRARILGKNRNVLKIQVQDAAGTQMDALYFGEIDRFLNYLEGKYGALAAERLLQGRRTGMKLAFTYYPDVNEYRGTKRVQLIIQNYQ